MNFAPEPLTSILSPRRGEAEESAASLAASCIMWAALASSNSALNVPKCSDSRACQVASTILPGCVTPRLDLDDAPRIIPA